MNHSGPAAGHHSSHCLLFLILGALILLEYGVFRTQMLRDTVPWYPFAYDQAAYLTSSYRLYEAMLAQGVFKALHHPEFLPQTLLFPIQAALWFVLTGASRLSALNINFIYFALVQTVGFLLVRRITGRTLSGFIFMGLLLSAGTLRWMNDFRTDFISCCLYGILFVALLRSEVFLNRKWTLLSLLLAVLLLGMRYVTITYVAGVCALLFVYYAGIFLVNARRKNMTARAAGKRLVNLLIFSCGIAAVFLPVILHSWQQIYRYYVTGHVLGDERLMRLKDVLVHTGIHSPWLFYPQIFLRMHLTPHLVQRIVHAFLFYLALAVLLVFLPVRNGRPASIRHAEMLDAIILLLAGVLVPFVVLTADVSKSALVICIVLVPFILLLTLLFFLLFQFVAARIPAKIASVLLVLTTIYFFIPGLNGYLHNVIFDSDAHAFAADKRQVVRRMTLDIGDYANFLRWKVVHVATDRPIDFVSAPLAPYYYEMRRVLFDVKTSKLGASIVNTVARSEAIHDLQQADVYTTDLNDYKLDEIYPFEKSIHPFRGLLQKLADNSMVRIGDYFIDGEMYRVYVRPDFRIDGPVHNQITHDGLWLVIPGIVAQQMRSVELSGDVLGYWKKDRQPDIRAVVDATSQVLLAGLQFTRGHYRILCMLPRWTSREPLVIHVMFPDYAGNAGPAQMLAPDRKSCHAG